MFALGRGRATHVSDRASLPVADQNCLSGLAATREASSPEDARVRVLVRQLGSAISSLSTLSELQQLQFVVLQDSTMPAKSWDTLCADFQSKRPGVLHSLKRFEA